ncbi:hypothetical protein M3Y97_01027600 [Aphelenchoides bicaudatus]|nr:hypothetical protein M3Y97_01027600 [Aphelenchoides bicaudatus]
MGIVELFVQSENFQRLYNCSFYDVDSIPVEKRQDRVYAVLLASLGIIFELMYIPCLYALSRKQVLAASFCYKLMLLMGIFDFVLLAFTSLVSAYFSWTGSMYCSHPTLMHIAGAFMHGFWLGYSQTSLILALNRCLSFSQYKWIFTEWRQYVWIGAPIALTVGVVLFGTSGCYNSIYKGWFFDVHKSYFNDYESLYSSRVQFYNNIVFIAFLPTIYFIFFVHHFLLARKRSKGMPPKAVGLFVQTLVINGTITAAVLGYTLMQYFQVPMQLVAASHITWILVQSAPPFIYLTLNQTVRQILFTDKKDVSSVTNNVTYRRVQQIIDKTVSDVTNTIYV